MRLLVIKPSSFGDIVHGLQVIQSLKIQKPETEITWICRNEWVPLVQSSPCVDHILIFDRHRYRSFFQLIKILRNKTFDAILDLQGLLRTGILTFFSRSKIKIGTAQAREGSCFLHKTSAPFPSKLQPHAIDFMLECLPLLDTQKEIFFPLQLKENTDNTSPKVPHYQYDLKKYILVFPNSRQKRKDWPFFPELAQTLLKQNVVVWSDSKPWDISFDSSNFINLTGKTSLEQVITLIKNAKLVIANDSGPMQLAAALEKKVIALFGPTRPSYAGPFPLDNPRNCAIKKGGEIQNISVQEVIRAVEQLLA